MDVKEELHVDAYEWKEGEEEDDDDSHRSKASAPMEHLEDLYLSSSDMSSGEDVNDDDVSIDPGTKSSDHNSTHEDTREDDAPPLAKHPKLESENTLSSPSSSSTPPSPMGSMSPSSLSLEPTSPSSPKPADIEEDAKVELEGDSHEVPHLADAVEPVEEKQPTSDAKSESDQRDVQLPLFSGIGGSLEDSLKSLEDEGSLPEHAGSGPSRSAIADDIGLGSREGSTQGKEKDQQGVDRSGSSIPGAGQKLPNPQLEAMRRKQKMDAEERQRMQILVAAFSEEQLNRYEMFRRSSFPKAAIKRYMQSIISCTVSQNVVIAMSGIAKVYVGEIVEHALDVMEQWGDVPPLQPKHIREAVRRMSNEGNVPSSRKTKSLFR